MVDERGRCIGRVQVFSSKAARDAWVADGPDYLTAAGYRETMLAKEAKNTWINCGT